MKKIIWLMSVVLITGCPRRGYEGEEYGIRRAIHIDGNRVCFTLDKNDVLESYSLSPNNNVFNELLLSYSSHLYYPDTCFTVNLEKAVVYGVDFKLNQKDYYYTFIIDNDGQALDIGWTGECPYPSIGSL